MFRLISKAATISYIPQRFEMNQQEKTNRRLAVLTVLSAIFMPRTLIAGIYGMNFDNMPELQHVFGYPAVLIFMALVGGGMYLYLRQRVGSINTGMRKRGTLPFFDRLPPSIPRQNNFGAFTSSYSPAPSFPTFFIGNLCWFPFGWIPATNCVYDRRGDGSPLTTGGDDD
jgi:hypothetical protein